MSRMKNALALALLTALLAGVVVLSRQVFTAPYPGLNDFMSRWEGARSYWVDGLNPYSEPANLNIQRRIYGRPAMADEDPGYFAYPFYTTFLVWPLVYLSYDWASAVWLVLLAAALVGALILQLDLAGWKPRPGWLALLILGSLVIYYPARGLLLGQPGLLVYLLQALALWALSRRLDWLAGAALAVSTFKPQMGFLIVPLLLLWGMSRRRWRFLGAFAGVFGGLLLASFALLPSWLGDWLAQLQLYPTYTALGSPVWIITRYYLGLGDWAEALAAAVLVGGMLWAWYRMLRHGESWLWTAALTLTVTHLVAPRTATPHYVVFTLPLIVVIRELVMRRSRWGSGWALVTLLALLVIPWVHFLATVEGEFEHPTVYLPPPLLMLLALWITRRRWPQEAR